MCRLADDQRPGIHTCLTGGKAAPRDVQTSQEHWQSLCQSATELHSGLLPAETWCPGEGGMGMLELH